MDWDLKCQRRTNHGLQMSSREQGSSNRVYNAKSAYHHWYEAHFVAEFLHEGSEIFYVPGWLLQKLCSTTSEELVKICMRLWSIWYWRSKKVWDGKTVTPANAMRNTFLVCSEWVDARKRLLMITDNQVTGRKDSHKPVFEAKAICVRETLSWIKDLRMQDKKIIVEIDSQLVFKAIENNHARGWRSTKSVKITTINKMNKKDVGVKIPFLDKDNYHHWMVKMHLHLLSQDEAYVDGIEKGPHVPMRAAIGNEPSVPKPRHE
ncbi:hypothetical protein AgCh_026118 [Apium graveolens]